MEYLTKCSQLWLTGQQQQQHNVLTSNTLVANIILVELKEIRKLVHLFFLVQSRLLHQWACLCKHASGQVLRVTLLIMEHKYVFTLRIVLKDRLVVAVDTGIFVRRMVIIVTKLNNWDKGLD